MNDPERTAKDLLIAFKCERFDGVPPIEVLRELKQNRGEYV